jgi:hypothetical protein
MVRRFPSSAFWSSSDRYRGLLAIAVGMLLPIRIAVADGPAPMLTESRPVFVAFECRDPIISHFFRPPDFDRWKAEIESVIVERCNESIKVWAFKQMARQTDAPRLEFELLHDADSERWYLNVRAINDSNAPIPNAEIEIPVFHVGDGVASGSPGLPPIAKLAARLKADLVKEWKPHDTDPQKSQSLIRGWLKEWYPVGEQPVFDEHVPVGVLPLPWLEYNYLIGTTFRVRCVGHPVRNEQQVTTKVRDDRCGRDYRRSPGAVAFEGLTVDCVRVELGPIQAAEWPNLKKFLKPGEFFLDVYSYSWQRGNRVALIAR